jgi:elongation factor P
LRKCSDEALVVVGGRVDEVAEEFEVGPFAFAARVGPIDVLEQRLGGVDELCQHEKSMAALIDAISVKRRTLFEHEGVPFVCLDSDVSTPTARGGQTLVRLKVRNLLTRGVFDKTFKAGDKFKEPDLAVVSASYLYSDGDGSHFLDQESFETLTLSADVIGDATDYLVDGTVIELQKYEGNPIGIELPQFVELAVAYTEPGVKGDTSSGSVTKPAKLETGLEIKVPLFIKQGEKVKVATETGEFAGRA